MSTIPFPTTPAQAESESYLSAWIDAWGEFPNSRQFKDPITQKETLLIMGDEGLMVIFRPFAIEYAWGTITYTSKGPNFQLNPSHTIYRRELEIVFEGDSDDAQA